MRERVKPTWRGSLGIGEDVSIKVEDAKMESLLKAFKKKSKGGNWKLKKDTFEHDLAFNQKRYGERFRLQTDNETDFDKFLLSFPNEQPNRIREQYYVSLSGVEKPKLIALNLEKKAEDYSATEWRQMKEKVRAEKKWPEFKQLNVDSVRIVFGPWKRPGTITSAVIQKENQTNKKSDAHGKFTIEYKKKVYPESGMGVLSFKCKYIIGKNGRRYGN